MVVASFAGSHGAFSQAFRETSPRSIVQVSRFSGNDCRMTTMRDVAAEVGVSVSTVSRALAGHRHVDEELRVRIEATARRLGYRPNAVARALRQTRSTVVGLVLPNIVNVTYATGAAVLQGVFQRLGYSVALFMTNNDPASDRDCLERLREQRVAGVVHVPCSAAGARALAHGADPIPVVELFRQSRSRRFDAVVADDQEGAFRVVSHLAALGHRRIGVITGDAGVSTTIRRQEGIARAFTAAGLRAGDCPVVYGDYSRRWGRRACEGLLAAPDPPTAIFATSTELVLGALLAAEIRGVRLPEDVSLAGLGNPDWYQVTRAPITAYSLPLEEMALAAAQLLLARITRLARDAEGPPAPTLFTVSGQFFPRASTAPPSH